MDFLCHAGGHAKAQTRGNYTFLQHPKDPSKTVYEINRSILSEDDETEEASKQGLNHAWPSQEKGLKDWAKNLACDVPGTLEYLYLMRLPEDAPIVSRTPSGTLFKYLAGGPFPSWQKKIPSDYCVKGRKKPLCCEVNVRNAVVLANISNLILENTAFSCAMTFHTTDLRFRNTVNTPF